MRRRIRNLLIIACSAAISMGCVFRSLEDDLEQLEEFAYLFAGSVISDIDKDHGIVVVAFYDAQATEITSYRMLPASGIFEIRSPARPTRFFAFADLNKDLTFQADEPFGWARGGEPIDPALGPTVGILIRIDGLSTGNPPFPAALVGATLDDHLKNYIRPSIGDVTPLDSPLFSRERAEKGLWTPFAFVEQGGAGIHFLDPYDPDRTPVLFVHGINATPRDFTTMINALDTTRYQPWVLSYPSGLRLSWVARGLYQFIEVLHRQHGFEELHVVAHSMGGLVSRGAINLCAQNKSCKYLASYQTISTPWNGVESASDGVKWAPTAVPVWYDLDPGSEYITTLFDTELPDGLPYHLLFGFRHDNMFMPESSDGVIKLSSQLRQSAQVDAATVRGFDEGHVSILENTAVLKQVHSVIVGTSGT